MRRFRSPFSRILLVPAFFLIAGSGVLRPIPAIAGVEGHWEGAFARDGAVQSVAFDFQTTDSGLVGTYDIPEMILYREPVRELSLTEDSLHLRVFWGRFGCVVHTNVGEITGQNPNWRPPVSLHLKTTRSEKRFHIQPVRFKGDAVELAGDLLLPLGNPPFPAVVIVEGSSTEGRALWTYRSIGDLFARNGIAALIYDKRGTGESGGNIAVTTFDELAHDVTSAVEFLSDRDDIDKSAIGIFGISQGGWIAPLVASRTADVSFAILLGGPAVSIWQQELDRVEYSMRAGINGENEPDAFTEAEIKAALAHTRLGFAVAEEPNRWDEWEKSLPQARSATWASYVALDSSLDELQGWLRYRYDPAETLRSLKTPLLALFGGNDVLVPPTENVPLMNRYLKEAGNDNSQIVVFPEVGHDFFTGATLVGGTWEWPTGFWRWNRRVPGLADSIVTWTKRKLAQ